MFSIMLFGLRYRERRAMRMYSQDLDFYPRLEAGLIPVMVGPLVTTRASFCPTFRYRSPSLLNRLASPNVSFLRKSRRPLCATIPQTRPAPRPNCGRSFMEYAQPVPAGLCCDHRSSLSVVVAAVEIWLIAYIGRRVDVTCSTVQPPADGLDFSQDGRCCLSCGLSSCCFCARRCT